MSLKDEPNSHPIRATKEIVLKSDPSLVQPDGVVPMEPETVQTTQPYFQEHMMHSQPIMLSNPTLQHEMTFQRDADLSVNQVPPATPCILYLKHVGYLEHAFQNYADIAAHLKVEMDSLADVLNDMETAQARFAETNSGNDLNESTQTFLRTTKSILSQCVALHERLQTQYDLRSWLDRLGVDELLPASAGATLRKLPQQQLSARAGFNVREFLDPLDNLCVASVGRRFFELLRELPEFDQLLMQSTTASSHQLHQMMGMSSPSWYNSMFGGPQLPESMDLLMTQQAQTPVENASTGDLSSPMLISGNVTTSPFMSNTITNTTTTTNSPSSSATTLPSSPNRKRNTPDSENDEEEGAAKRIKLSQEHQPSEGNQSTSPISIPPPTVTPPPPVTPVLGLPTPLLMPQHHQHFTQHHVPFLHTHSPIQLTHVIPPPILGTPGSSVVGDSTNGHASTNSTTNTATTTNPEMDFYNYMGGILQQIGAIPHHLPLGVAGTSVNSTLITQPEIKKRKKMSKSSCELSDDSMCRSVDGSAPRARIPRDTKALWGFDADDVKREYENLMREGQQDKRGFKWSVIAKKLGNEEFVSHSDAGPKLKAVLRRKYPELLGEKIKVPDDPKTEWGFTAEEVRTKIEELCASEGLSSPGSGSHKSVSLSKIGAILGHKVAKDPKHKPFAQRSDRGQLVHALLKQKYPELAKKFERQRK